MNRSDRAAKRGWSLTSRLTLWFSLSAFLLVCGATTALYLSLERTLNLEDSLYISDKLQTMIDLLARGPAQGAAIRERVEREWGRRTFERVYVKVFASNGDTVAETPGFEKLPSSLFQNLVLADPAHVRSTVKRREGNDHVYKVAQVSVDIKNDSDRDRVIQIALDRTQEYAILARYRKRLMVLLAITFMVAILVGRRIAARGIEPVSQIALAMKRIRSTTLHERISIENVPDELVALANTFNEMLDRLNEAFARLSQFSADIAHDLRTPINNLRGEIEVALGRPRTQSDYQDALASCLEECARISQLIDNLLFLARSENPHDELAVEPIELSTELSRLCEFFDVAASEANVAINVDVSDSLRLNCNRPLLQRALGNLLANALRHTPPGGSVRISAAQEPKATTIEVRDTGIGIAAEHLPRVFDRFYRVDASRNAKSGNSGLGLSIVQGIMRLHHGEVTITSTPGQGTVVRLVFPLVQTGAVG